MGNTVYEFVFVFCSACVFWIIGEIVLTNYIRNERKKLKHLIRIENTRSYFAELRQKLVSYTLNGKIDNNSDIFISLYKIYTLILRNPDHYEEISNLLLLSILDSKKDVVVKEEKEIYSNEIKALLLATSTGLNLIINDYSLTKFSNYLNIIKKFKNKKYIELEISNISSKISIFEEMGIKYQRLDLIKIKINRYKKENDSLELVLRNGIAENILNELKDITHELDVVYNNAKNINKKIANNSYNFEKGNKTISTIQRAKNRLIEVSV